jgi:hypothetical protein
MNDVKNELSKLGFKKITDFFVENMLCELWRIITANKLLKSHMTTEDKCDILLSDEFQEYVQKSRPTKNPDLYFRNPFTNQWIHLFRVDTQLKMRPSFVNNDNSNSVTLKYNIHHDDVTGRTVVIWQGEYLKSIGKEPSRLFV